MFLKLIIITALLIGLAFAGIAIKIILTKKGEFKKSCSSVDPGTGERLGCSCGNADGGEGCRNR